MAYDTWFDYMNVKINAAIIEVENIAQVSENRDLSDDKQEWICLRANLCSLKKKIDEAVNNISKGVDK